MIGILVVVSSFVWIGKESGWWDFEFPFCPVMFLLMGIGVIIEAIRKLRQD